VGTSSPLGGSTNNGFYSLIQIRGNTAGSTLEGRLSLGTNKASNTVVAGSDLGAIWFQDGSGGDYASIQGQGDGASGTNDYPGRLVFSTTADGASSPSPRMTITSAGNVGIGTTSPAASLDVNGNIRISSAVGLEIASSSNSTITHKSGGSSTAYYTYLDASRNYIWQDNATERMRIDSSGRLLVGASTTGGISGARFQVAQTSNYCGEFTQYSNDAFGSYFFISKSRGTLGNQGLVQSGDEIGVIGFSASNGTTYNTAALIQVAVDGTPGANDMPGRLVFSTTADGASFPTERMRITSTGQVRLAGAGITFNGDTATANELDDYEEGTWTPTLNLSTTQYAGVSYNSWTKGYYRKIGSLVHVQGVLITNDIDTTSGAGGVRIGGLPFASPANASGENYTGTSSISIGFADAWTTVQPSTAEVLSNSSLIALYAEDATGERTGLSTANVTDANFSNIIRFAGTYIAA
jgi:hypothetical protein